MKVIVVSDAIASLDSGQEVVNLSRHPEREQRVKMDRALELFRKYGWEVEDKRAKSNSGAVS